MPSLAALLIQIAAILLAARSVGALLRRLGQPQVIGEMVAGILLGPSLLGALAPGVSSALFPEESLGFLAAISGLGVVLFMFLMGLEVDPGLLRGKGRAAFLTSQAGILVPFCLGALLGLFLYPDLAHEGVPKAHFALFMGTAMAITAFPVLARILNERGLMATSLGAMAMACAAADDVAGWTILAGVVLLTRSQEVSSSLLLVGAGVLAFGAAQWFVIRPLVKKIVEIYLRRGFLSNDLFALIVLLALGSAVASELAGVHALFGAFLFGVLVPRRSDFVPAVLAKMQDVTVVLLLPVFFALTGLRTRVDLLSGAAMWGYCALIILVAITGKFGGTTAAARLSGLSWREAGALGVLMNTRGLMELIVLNVGLEIGVISPAVFTMMVLMALVTTLMTSPLLGVIYRESQTGAEAPAPVLEKRFG
jgi:Kef-type K+ transport system membrane component KefB